MIKYLWAFLFISTSALALDTMGTESGTGSNESAACKIARNTAESRASLAMLGNSKKPKFSACQCSRTSSGYECIVSWSVE